MRKGTLIVISGFSGTGKGTIVAELIKKYSNYELSISATTRPKRNYEEHGREYYFYSKDEFEKLISSDGLLEWTQYIDNYYGTPKQMVLDRLEKGKDIILEIEMDGAKKIKDIYEDALLIFLIPPSYSILKKRLIDRGTETLDIIAERLERAKEEVDYMYTYDYIVTNHQDKISDTCEAINTIIKANRYATRNNQKDIEKIKNEILQEKI